MGGMMAVKMSLFEQNFIGENVIITTTLRQAVNTPEGDIVEVPLMYEGTVLDVDTNSVLLDLSPQGIIRLIMLDKIVDVEVADESRVEIDIPNKPNKKDMN